MYCKLLKMYKPVFQLVLLLGILSLAGCHEEHNPNSSFLSPGKPQSGQCADEHNQTHSMNNVEQASSARLLRKHLQSRLLSLKNGEKWPRGVAIRNTPVRVLPWPKEGAVDFSGLELRFILPPSSFRLAISNSKSIWTRRQETGMLCVYRRDDDRRAIDALPRGGVGDVGDCLEFLWNSLKRELVEDAQRAALRETYETLKQWPDEELFVKVMSLDANKVLKETEPPISTLLLALAAAEHQALYTEAGWSRMDNESSTIYASQYNGRHGHNVIVFDKNGKLLVSFYAGSKPIDLRDVLRTAVSVRAWPAGETKQFTLPVPTENSGEDEK